MGDYLQPAGLRDRALAAVADIGGCVVVFWLLWQINFIVPGALLTSAYILFRDSLGGKSWGKRWRGLCAIQLRTQAPCDWKDSFYRNLFICVPVLGVGMTVAEALWAFYRDPDLRRIGDHFANTLVIREVSLSGDDQDEEERSETDERET